jgi:outer membrane lipoprotein-sorting protein
MFLLRESKVISGAVFGLAVLLGCSALAVAARPAAAQALPSLQALVASVQANQNTLDKTRESYTYRELQVMQELDGSGAVKKRKSREYYVFYVHGHPVQHLVSEDGKPLTGKDAAKEQAHLQYKVQQAQNTPPGDPLNAKHSVTIARMLTLDHFTNERRVEIDDRPTIALDFLGDRSASTHGIAEDAVKHLSGTVWIDERDHEVRRVKATLDSPMRLELGLVSLSQGSTFTFDQKLINNEVWLPTGATVRIEAHAAFFLRYHLLVTVTDDHYQRFHTSAEQQRAVQSKH